MKMIALKLVLGFISTCTLISAASAATVNLSTADNPYNPGISNQGWISGTYENTVKHENDSVLTGYTVFMGGFFSTRSYFIFDLTDVQGQVDSATLSIRTGSTVSPLNQPTETVGFFDVSTSPDMLNASLMSETIFDDLGSGSMYGQVEIEVGSDDEIVLEIVLNQLALDDINANLGGQFAIGGSLLSLGGLMYEGPELVFGNILYEPGVPTAAATNLSLNVVAPVPVPAAVWLFFSGIVGLFGYAKVRPQA